MLRGSWLQLMWPSARGARASGSYYITYTLFHDVTQRPHIRRPSGSVTGENTTRQWDGSDDRSYVFVFSYRRQRYGSIEATSQILGGVRQKNNVAACFEHLDVFSRLAVDACLRATCFPFMYCT